MRAVNEDLKESDDSKRQQEESIEKQSKSPFDLFLKQIWRKTSFAERGSHPSVSRFFGFSNTTSEKSNETENVPERVEKEEEGEIVPDLENNISKTPGAIDSTDHEDNNAAGWAQVKEFTEKPGKKAQYRFLNLNNSWLTSNEIVELATIFPCLPALEELDLSWNDLIGGSLKLLTTHMQHIPKLQVLSLSNCRLTSADVSALGDAIPFLPHLEEVDLSYNNCLGGNLFHLTQKLKPGCNLKILKFMDCNLIAEDGSSLVITLGHLSDLTELDFSCNKNVGGAFNEVGTELLNLTKLCVLDVHQCSLTKEDISILTQVIPLLANLQVLNLALNKHIGTAEQLFARLRFLPKLKDFIASNCSLTKDSITELADTIPNLTTLEMLDLSWNKCLGGNIKLLAEVFQYVTHLQVLRLSSCNLTIQDLAALVSVSCAGHLPELQMLDLMYNGTIDDQSWGTFFQELTGLNSLLELDISLQPSTRRDSSPWFPALLDSLSRFPSLTHLGMQRWTFSTIQREFLHAFNQQNKRNIHFEYCYSPLLPPPEGKYSRNR
ncbi:leucine-rich repeat-containing protein 31 isoform X4 [Callorhinchus milii]|uniref:leucine-rich repeat-containing protein 31 isoform X4 n=1 Tax=Callorhinchus milii TaxID=7868 RepID=UPI001C3F7D15|nr:leucine-rich repeat-containing protein 31 isoform X4 [Callorhinchus milii]